MFSLRAWHIWNVFVNNASLYNHDQVATYNAAVSPVRGRKRVEVRPYESTRVQRVLINTPKAEENLSLEAISSVSTKRCCRLNSVQFYPRLKIEALRNQF